MNLYLAVQWGNLKDGANGNDTQVLVRAESFDNAIKIGQEQLKYLDWKEGRLDSVILLGNDLAKDGKEEVINIPWENPGYAKGEYEKWNWDSYDKKWKTDEEIDRE